VGRVDKGLLPSGKWPTERRFPVACVDPSEVVISIVVAFFGR
jgi:hypothetical protein